MTVTLRPERPSDEAAIGEITRQAYLSNPHRNQTE